MPEHALLKRDDENGGADDVQVCGAVKWFDAVRGYGFIVPDDGSSDVLVHFTVLRDVGRRTLPEGAMVTCLAVQRDRGRQARKILDLDLTTAIGPDPEAALQRAASRNDPLAQLHRVEELARDWGSDVVDLGAVGHLNPASGYGEWPQAETLIARLSAAQ